MRVRRHNAKDETERHDARKMTNPQIVAGPNNVGNRKRP